MQFWLGAFIGIAVSYVFFVARSIYSPPPGIDYRELAKENPRSALSAFFQFADRSVHFLLPTNERTRSIDPRVFADSSVTEATFEIERATIVGFRVLSSPVAFLIQQAARWTWLVIATATIPYAYLANNSALLSAALLLNMAVMFSAFFFDRYIADFALSRGLFRQHTIVFGETRLRMQAMDSFANNLTNVAIPYVACDRFAIGDWNGPYVATFRPKGLFLKLTDESSFVLVNFPSRPSSLVHETHLAGRLAASMQSWTNVDETGAQPLARVTSSSLANSP